MNFKDIILTANANLSRSKLRTTLTILAIFIGAFTLTLTSGLGSGISSYVDSQVSNLGASNLINISAKSDSSTTSSEPQKYDSTKVTAQSALPGQSSVTVLTDADITRLKANSDLSNIIATRLISPSYIQGPSSQKYKVSQTQGTVGSVLDLKSGTNLELNSSQSQLIIPASYVSALGYSTSQDAIGKTVTIGIDDSNGQTHEVQGVIVGVQNKGLTGSSSITTNTTLSDSLYDQQSIGLSSVKKNQYTSIIATYKSDLTDAQITSLKKTLNDEGYSGLTVADALGTFQTIVSSIVYILDAFAIIALLAASFGIINTLFMSVQERTKEIGLMKAMGMPSGRIFGLFSVEAILIGFWGSVVGVVGAMGIGALANKIVTATLLKNLPDFTLLAFPPANVLSIIGLIMLIAFLAGALPARKASKQNPIDALKYE